MIHQTLHTTSLGKQLQQQVKTIYASLIKFGCNFIEPTSDQSILSVMDMFFQPSHSRLQLIEWLIATINPWYDQEPSYKNCYDDDPHQHKIKKLCISLWQLGVMPFSKHTKNLDYGKYVEGLLGFESSVKLILNLVELGQAKFGSNLPVQMQRATGDLLGQLINNHKQLVNVDYDPYGVTLPPQNPIGKDDELDAQIQNQYNELKEQILGSYDKQNEDDDIGELNDYVGNVMQEMQTYKQKFTQQYQMLADKISQLSTRFKGIIVDNGEQKEQIGLHGSRILNIDRNLCDQYRQYKALINSIKEPNYEENNKIKHLEIVYEIQNINMIDPFKFQ